MGNNNLVFLENLEWFDESGKETGSPASRNPGSGEIKWGDPANGARKARWRSFFTEERPSKPSVVRADTP